MAHARWSCSGSIQVDLAALEQVLRRFQFEVSNADVSSGFVFALPLPGMKYDERMMSILISWSPRRLDGYMVEIRSNEPKGRTRTTCDKLAKLLRPALAELMGC